MLLGHITRVDSIQKIITDGYIKPSSKTGRLNQGVGIYEQSPYVFTFALPNKREIVLSMKEPTIIFDSSYLIDKPFYTNKNHSGGNEETSKKYTYSSKEKIDNVLEKLYNRSKKISDTIARQLHREKGYSLEFPYFVVFQEVFLLGSMPMDKATSIIIPEGYSISKSMKELIKKKYPNLKISVDLGWEHNGGADYRYKYIKYKTKYLQLKSQVR
jgi:hypothetical protein